MKVTGNGQARVLTTEDLRRLFDDGFIKERDKALFAICLYTGCRISEALSLHTSDIQCGMITFRKANTKGKLHTRAVDMQPQLASLLFNYMPDVYGALFPGVRGVTEHLTRFTADKILRLACDRVGLVGVSTHSFRRTSLTIMSSANVPLRHIQEISGHQSLSTLQRYLEVSPQQKREAVSAISF